MLTKRNGIIVAIVLGLMGLQYCFGPKKVVTKTVEVIKLVEVINRDIEIIETKDGTKTTKIKERINRQEDQTKSSVRSVSPQNKEWLVSVSRSLTNDVYSASLQRRVIFDLYAGVYATTKGEIGIGITYNF